jgi:hypothetical protein
VSGQIHVNPLDLPSGEVPLHEQVEADEGKQQPNRFGPLVGVLRGKGVHHVLVNEGAIAQRERVGAQGVVRASFGDRTVSLLGRRHLSPRSRSLLDAILANSNGLGIASPSERGALSPLGRSCVTLACSWRHGAASG